MCSAVRPSRALSSHIEQEGPVARVGVLGPSLDRPALGAAYPFFLAELRKLGFVEGRNLLVEPRRIDQGVPKPSPPPTN